jgi:hypothetical protein
LGGDRSIATSRQSYEKMLNPTNSATISNTVPQKRRLPVPS